MDKVEDRESGRPTIDNPDEESSSADSQDTMPDSKDSLITSERCLPSDNSSVLISSENVNNENREKELLLSSSTHGTDQEVRMESPSIPTNSLPDANEGNSIIDNTPPKAVADGNNIDCVNNSEQTTISSATEAVSTKVDDEPISKSDAVDDAYSKHITYNDKGIAIYTDPNTKCQYEFDKDKNDWIPENKDTGSVYENEFYRWCHETNTWIPKDPSSISGAEENEFYKYDAEKKEWVPKVGNNAPVTSTDGQHHTYTDQDGTVFFWDPEKNAWFPKIDDDFMAQYQLGYGNYKDTSADNEKPQVRESNMEGERPKEVDLKRKAVKPPNWFDIPPDQNTKVYVSNLPSDITEEEFIELMSKYGMIYRDPASNKMKVKLYSDESGQLKGDALCNYIRIESVDMALKLLHGLELRGRKIKVEQAKFQMRGEYNPSLKPKKKKKDKEKLKKMQERLYQLKVIIKSLLNLCSTLRLFDWRPEKMRGERSKHERIVIIKNLFTPELFEQEVHLIIDYQKDLRDECAKCGTVRKVIVYDRHPEGVAQVNMGDPEEADLVIQMMNRRYFGKRQLQAEIWDGKTNYKIEETKLETEERLSNWNKYLAADEKEKVASNELVQLEENSTAVEAVVESEKLHSNIKS